MCMIIQTYWRILQILKDSISFKIVDDELNIKYQTIKGYNLDKYEYNYHSSKKDD